MDRATLGPAQPDYQAEVLLELGNIVDMSSAHRIGLYLHGDTVQYFLNGELQGTTEFADFVVQSIGLASFASEGSPGAWYDYLWVGPSPINFDPQSHSANTMATTGIEESF